MLAIRKRSWMVALALLLAPASALAEPLDEALYGRLLQRFTREVTDTAGVRVDYRGLARAPAWKRLIANLENTDPTDLASREAKLAYWINVYNILAIDLVVQYDPDESIRDIGSFLRPVWNRRAGTIAGRDYSLGEIEHEILRPLNEPRIHTAIVCASVSCPTLRREPWTAAGLDGQLDSGLRRFLGNPDKGARFDQAGGRLWLSRIFDWFAEDFESRGSVRTYLVPYLPDAAGSWLRGDGADARLRYLDYDWKLNALPG